MLKFLNSNWLVLLSLAVKVLLRVRIIFSVNGAAIYKFLRENWDYPKLNSLYRALVAVMLLSIVIWSSFGFLSLEHPKHVGAQEHRISNYAHDDIKYKLLPRMVMFDLPSKQEIEANRTLVDSFKQLLGQADSYLTKEPTSVMEKKQTPSSGDKHDFLSLSPYYWPDLTKPSGLPYIHRDGKTNPEVDSIPDARNMQEMIKRVRILSVAYYYTDNISYASKASELLRVWFLNNNTHMNPNLQHSQVIPGRNNGSYSGIIEGIYFRNLIDAIGLIQDSVTWTEQDQRGIELWFGKYLEWLLNSDTGKKAGKALNNHGTWYDVQVSSIALFLNKIEITGKILKNNIDKLIAAKIQPDGPQPFEIHRRTSLDYHMFNLLAFFNLAKIGDYIGIDLWDYKTPQGSGLQKELDYLIPYALDREKWPYEQIKPIDTGKLLDLLCQASIHYEGDETFKQVYRSIYQPNVKEIDNLIYGCIIP